MSEIERVFPRRQHQQVADLIHEVERRLGTDGTGLANQHGFHPGFIARLENGEMPTREEAGLLDDRLGANFKDII